MPLFTAVEQQTTPPELPIYGDPYTEIALELIFSKGKPLFILNGKSLQLLQPLDRDEENLSHIVFQVSCTIRPNGRKRNIPIIVRVSDVNDNPPVFVNTPYEASVAEVSFILFTIFLLKFYCIIKQFVKQYSVYFKNSQNSFQSKSRVSKDRIYK